MGTDRAYRLWQACRAAGSVDGKHEDESLRAGLVPRRLGRNHVWAYDFVFDTSATGQQIKCLTVVDEWTREALAIDVSGSIRSERA